jgi:hypothetical protein
MARLESSARRGLEMFLLAMALIFGVGVIGGCAAIGATVAGAGPLLALAGLPVGLLLAGIVYLATSMSRDVRILRQRLLDQEEEARKAKSG